MKKINKSRKSYQTGNIFEKVLICNLKSTKNYQDTDFINTIINAFVLVISLVIQIYTFCNQVITGQPENIVAPIMKFAFIEFVVAVLLAAIGFVAAWKISYDNLTILKLAFLFSGYLTYEDIHWHKICPIASINSDDAYIEWVVYKIKSSGDFVLFSQLKIVRSDGLFLATSNSKQIEIINKCLESNI